MAMIYLGGAIDMATAQERTNWRDDLKKVLKGQYGHSSFDPASAFHVDLADHATMKHLVNINKHAMSKCDVVMLVMNDKTPSIGTPIELYMATHEMSGYGFSQVEHVVVWNPHDADQIHKYDIYNLGLRSKRDFVPSELPAYISGNTTHVVSSFRDAILFINHVSKGKPASEFFKKEMMQPCSSCPSDSDQNMIDLKDIADAEGITELEALERLTGTGVITSREYLKPLKYDKDQGFVEHLPEEDGHAD